MINSDILKKQIDFPDDLNDEINIPDIVVLIKAFHEYSKFLLVDSMNEDSIKQIIIFYFVNDYGFHTKSSENIGKVIQGSKNEKSNEEEQLAIILEGCSLLFVDHQEKVIIHDYQDPLAGNLS